MSSLHISRNKLRVERFKKLILFHVHKNCSWWASEHIPFKIFLNSIPKSGTNLLIKCLQLLPDAQDSTISFHSEMYGTPWHPELLFMQRLWKLFPSINMSYKTASLALTKYEDTHGGSYIPIGGFHNIFVPQKQLSSLLSMMPKGWFMSGHMPFSRELEQIFMEENFKMFLIIRDPRDVITSEINYFLSRKHLSLHAYYKSIEFEQGMISIIKGVPSVSTSVPSQPSFGKVWEEYLPWMNKPYVHVIRFEDLVGLEGGGSKKSQIKQIKEIAEYLECNLPERDIENIGHNLFGGTHTFRKGVIGSWKTSFSPEVKIVFKECLGHLLIDLGYEKDYRW